MVFSPVSGLSYILIFGSRYCFPTGYKFIVCPWVYHDETLFKALLTLFVSYILRRFLKKLP